MSLFGAVTTAVSGLNAQEIALGNISNNVANSQTVGFKQIDTSFESLVVSVNNGAGGEGSVAASSSSQTNVSGALVASQEATSIALNGNGLFAVSASTSAAGATAPTFSPQNFYTRRGDFTQDKNGYLVNGAGYYLEGYNVNPTTGVPTGTTLAPIQVPQNQSTPQATSLTNLVANLPSSYAIQGTSGYTSPSPVTTTIYDAQGGAHTLSVQFDKTAANTWNASMTTDGNSTPVTQLTLNFSDGTTALGTGTAAAGTLVSVVDAGSTTAATVATAGTGVAATIGATLSLNGVVQTMTLNLGTYGGTTGLTQYAGSNVSVTSETQNGFASGSLSSVAIDANGYVNASYSNNQIVKIGQVAVAQFGDENQLNAVNGGAYIATATSGTPLVSAPGANGAATISPSTLEQSNVSISDELTKMIIAQQAYTSNARVITIANQMVQTLNGLIQ